MERIAILALAALAIVSAAYAEDSLKLERIVVTPSRFATDIADSSRSVTLLDSKALDSSAYKTIPDVIREKGGIDIRTRGQMNVQSDISIRGTSFEQNTVLIDGVSVNDPQTGHYTMYIPLTMMDVDAIEILKGPASSLYGANAFGGVVNVITKRPDRDEIKIYAEGGSFDYAGGGVSVSKASRPVKNRFSFTQSRSTGYMSQTDFDILSITESAAIDTAVGVYNFLFGYLNKDFGAADFYSNLYPNEYEKTDTRFFKIDGKTDLGKFIIEPVLFLRRHWDKFVLDQNRTGWQTNYHTTYSYGGGVKFRLDKEFSDVSWGYDLSRDTIDSTNIQTHARTKDGLYFEISPRITDRLNLNIGFREDYYTEFGWDSSPSVSASYKAARHITLRGSAGRAYRVPTFTDLYYNDAANAGNSGLKPESSWSYEAGARFGEDSLYMDAAYFFRQSYDTIDWIRYSTKERWRASNTGSSRTNGLELTFSINPDKVFDIPTVNRVFVTNTILDTYAKHDYISKYALDYAKEQLSAGIDLDMAGFKNSWILNYKKRIGDSGYLVTNIRISKEIVNKNRAVFEAYIDISNLFDVSYSEESDVEMPGRWIKSGASFKF